MLELPIQPVFLAGFDQRAHQTVQGHEQNPVAGLRSLYAEGDRQVGFAHARGSQQDHVLVAFHEPKAGQFSHQLAVNARLEAEVELLQGFDPG